MRNKILVFSLLLFLFILSVFIRLSNLERPLGKQQDSITAHVLTTNKLWLEYGIASYKYNLVFSYPETINKAQRNEKKQVFDKQGNAYYVSYPPFAFYLPYSIFRTFEIIPTYKAIAVLGLCIHLVCAILIFLILRKTYQTSSFPVVVGSITAYCFYVFSSGNLWFHCNAYFADTVEQLFFISLVYTFIILQTNKNKVNKSLLLSIGALNFLSIYTEWLGIFLSLVMIIISLKKRKENVNYKHLSLILVVTTIAPIVLMIMQYSQINTLESLFTTFSYRYSERSGVTSSDSTNISVLSYIIFCAKSLLKIQLNSYIKFLYLLSLLSIIYIIKNKTEIIKLFKNSLIRMLLVLTILPVLIHNLVFIDFNCAHQFGALKASFFYSIITGIMMKEVLADFSSSMNYIRNSLYIVVIIMLTYTIYNSVNIYKANYDPKEASLLYLDIGKTFKTNATNDEVLLTNENVRVPVMLYYTERNVATVDTAHIKSYLNEMGAKKGFYIATDLGKIKWFKHINLNDSLKENALIH